MNPALKAIAISPMAEVAGEFTPLHSLPGHPHLQGSCPLCGGHLDVVPWCMRPVADGTHGLWYCHDCRQGGDVLSFVQKVACLSLEDGVAFLFARAALMDELRLLGA